MEFIIINKKNNYNIKNTNMMHDASCGILTEYLLRSNKVSTWEKRVYTN